MAKLKPCPFCGDTAKIRRQQGWKRNTYYPSGMGFVECNRCHAKTGTKTVENAEKAWNRRAEDAAD